MNDMSPMTRELPSARRPPPRLANEELPPRILEVRQRYQSLLAEPFIGVTTDGKPVAGLYPLAEKGAPTSGIVAAAQAFLASLTACQRTSVSFQLGSPPQRAWSNIHRNLMRHGLCLEELSDEQRALALALVKASTSAKFYDGVLNAMRLNHHLRELIGQAHEYGEWFVWLSFFGEPSATAPWAWQLDGHHINLNCAVQGEQMVLAPALLGAEPVSAQSGKYKGATVLRDEEAACWRLMTALTPDQQKRATIGMDLPFDGYASGFRDNFKTPYQGLPVQELTAAQRPLLDAMLGVFVGRMPPEHAPLKLKQITAHLNQTHFAWIGETGDTAPFYCRLHGPVIYIEFYHQPGVALENTGYSRRHAHALVREPNGNDYGRALLAQHRPRSGA